MHVGSRQCLETNITRRPFSRRMTFLYLSNMGYQPSFSSMYPCKPTNNVGPTDCNRATVGIPCSYTQQDSASIERVSWLSLIPVWLVAHYIIFSTSHVFPWSCSSRFNNSKPWLPKRFLQVLLEPNQAEQQALHTMNHLARHSSNPNTS